MLQYFFFLFRLSYAVKDVILMTDISYKQDIFDIQVHRHQSILHDDPREYFQKYIYCKPPVSSIRAWGPAEVHIIGINGGII